MPDLASFKDFQNASFPIPLGATTPSVIGQHEVDEVRFLFGALIVPGVDVVDIAALVGLWFGPGPDGDGFTGFAADAVRIRHHEFALVFRIRFQVHDAAGE